MSLKHLIPTARHHQREGRNCKLHATMALHNSHLPCAFFFASSLFNVLAPSSQIACHCYFLNPLNKVLPSNCNHDTVLHYHITTHGNKLPVLLLLLSKLLWIVHHHSFFSYSCRSWRGGGRRKLLNPPRCCWMNKSLRVEHVLETRLLDS